MSHTEPVNHFYFNKFIKNGQAISDFTLTAFSGDIGEAEASRLYLSATLGSYNQVSAFDQFTQAVSLVQHSAEEFLLVHVRRSPVRQRLHYYPDYHIIRLPAQLAASQRLRSLLTLLDSQPTHPSFAPPAARIDPLAFDSSVIIETSALAALQHVYRIFQERMETLTQAVSVLASGKPLSIRYLPGDLEGKILLVEGLMQFLPEQIRPSLTFATEVFDGEHCKAQIKLLFNDSYARPGPKDGVWIFGTTTFQEPGKPHPYAQWLFSEVRLPADQMLARVSDFTACLKEYPQEIPVEKSFRIAALRLSIQQKEASGQLDRPALEEILEIDSYMPEARKKAFYEKLIEFAVRDPKPSALGDFFNRVRPPIWFSDVFRRKANELLLQELGERVLPIYKELVFFAPEDTGLTLTVEDLSKAYNSQFDRLAVPTGSLTRMERFLDSIIEETRENLSAELWNKVIHRWAVLAKGRKVLSQRLFQMVAVYLSARQLAFPDQTLQPSEAALFEKLLLDPDTIALFPRELEEFCKYLRLQEDDMPIVIGEKVLMNALAALDPGKYKPEVLIQLCSLAMKKRSSLGLINERVWIELIAIRNGSEVGKKLVDGLDDALDARKCAEALNLGSKKLLIQMRFKGKKVALLAAFVDALRNNKQFDWLNYTIISLLEHQPNDMAEFRQYLTKYQFSDIQLAPLNKLVLDHAGWEGFPILVEQVAACWLRNQCELNASQIIKMIKQLENDRKEALLNSVLERHIQQVCDPKNALYAPDWVNQVYALWQEVLTSQRALNRLLEEFCKTIDALPTNDIFRILQAIESHPHDLSDFHQRAYSIYVFKRIIGSGGIEDFKHQVADALNLLTRLHDAFDNAGKQAFDWATFEQQISVIHGKSKDFQLVAQQCKQLVDVVDSMSDKRSLLIVDPLKKQQALNEEICSGKRPPKGGLDALLRLAGIFERTRPY